MKIAVHSDLHTELSLCRLENLGAADLLVLAGDIGDSASLPLFFAALREQAPDLPVLYVLGNHDRYGFTYGGGLAEHRAIAEKFAVRLLEDEAVRIADVLFCGTTLWTDFRLGGDAAASMAWAGETLPDYRHISCDDGTPLTPAVMVEWFGRACAFLETAFAQAGRVRKKVVISHFLPAKELLAEKYRRGHGDLLRSSYWASDLPQLYRQADVWIYGHSHDNIACTIAATDFLSNQRGYSRRENGQEDNGYRADYLLEI